MNTIPPKTASKIKVELYRFLIYASFLSLIFCALSTYKRLILGEYSISYLHYGYGLIQGLILAKIIVIGEMFRLGERFATKPLIIPTLYKTLIFTIFVFFFALFEHFFTGYLKGKSSLQIYEEFLNHGLDEILAKALLLFFVFILFFAFLEISNWLGGNKLIKLFFSKPSSDKK
jgi:hypothetical protein